MLASERLIYIKQLLESKKVINIKNISTELSISESTARRDFEELERQGLIQRVHGGAVRAKSEKLDTVELSMSRKAIINTENKKRVCMEAAKMVKDGDCIFIDGGTSLMYMLEYLSKKKIKIVTHSMLKIQSIENSTAEIIVIGGKYLPDYKMNVGPIAVEAMRHFSFDCAFVGCTSVELNENRAYTIDMESALIKQTAMKNSLTKYLLTDKSKLNIKGFYKFSFLNEYDAIFTDKYPENMEKPDNIVICSGKGKIPKKKI